jgi:4-amino-4-deoxy-L-arabinose transferase
VVELSAAAPASTAGERPRWPWRLLAIVALLAYALAFQGSRGLWEPDEGRYGNIAVQMLRSGDFVVPAFNEDVPHFAKPPLTYWAIAAGLVAAGRNEWGARFANALAFVATVLVVCRLGSRFVPRRPWLPALVYATFLLPYSAANVITTDTLLTLWEASAGLGFVAWWERRDGPRWRPPLLLMWLSFALAFLTKGPAGLLPLAAFAAFAALAGGWRSAARLFCLGGVAVFAVVGLGWYFFVAATNPGLMEYFVRDEVASRIVSGAYRRNTGWNRAFETYAPTLVLGALPWAVWWVPAVYRTGRALLGRAWWRVRLEREPRLVLAALWIGLPLVVFTVSASRLPLYLLPLFVPLALVTAMALPGRVNAKAALPLLSLWVVALVGLRVLAAGYPSPVDGRRTAATITAAISPVPAEIVFVDVKPVWGLSLYLGCEIERLSTRTAPGVTVEGVSPETLRTELARHEPGTLLLIRQSDEAAAAEALARLGRPYLPLGLLGDAVMVSPFGDLHRVARAPDS